MRFLIIVLFLFTGGAGFAQSIEDHSRLYRQPETRRQAFAMAATMVHTDSTRAYANHALGIHYKDNQQWDSAAYYFQRAVTDDGDSTWIAAWAHIWLGKYYLNSGFKLQAVLELNSAANMAATMNSVAYANRLLDSLGQGSGSTMLTRFPDWKTMESEHLIFKFQDTTGWSRFAPDFITRHERAFRQSDSVFQAKLPKKLRCLCGNIPSRPVAY